MKNIRQDAITMATKAKKFGIVLGTLGRQGAPKVLQASSFMCHEQFCAQLCSYMFAVKEL